MKISNFIKTSNKVKISNGVNSKTKVFTIGFVLILGAILLSGASCAKNNGGAPTTDKPSASKSAGWSSDAVKCADLMAYTSRMSVLAQRQDMTAIAAIQQKIGEDLNKYFGWDSYEDMQETCVPISKQSGFMELMVKRMQELGLVDK